MKKSFKLEDLDCANCAAKMEEAISKLPGVKKVNINFMAQKMILEAEDDQFDAVLAQVQKTIKDVEPDCTVIV
jgi:copper chaperone CopZ